MKNILRCFILLFSTVTGMLFANDATCVVAPPDSGYGANGPYAVVADSFEAPGWQLRHVHVFYPENITAPVPAIFLCHKFGATHPSEYSGLIAHLVSKGYFVAYSPTPRMTFARKQVKKYDITKQGCIEALRRYADRIDTTRIGFVAHGFGGGAAPAIAKEILHTRKWGANGAFMFIMAPWYTYHISQRELKNYPSHVKLIVQVYEGDNINDPRIARDIFLSMGVATSEKDFLFVYNDKHASCELRADNTTPLSRGSLYGTENALDYWGIYRPLDALAEYAFTGSAVAKKIALGTGKDREMPMGTWPGGTPVKKMIATDSPQHFMTNGPYINSWIGQRNPRIETSRFKKARKLFISYYKRKIKLLAKHGKSTVQAKLDDDEIEIMPNPILEGYGSNGPHEMRIYSFPSPRFPELKVQVYHPAKLKSPQPAILFIHGYSGPDPLLFEPLINHIVSTGYPVIFSPFPILPVASNTETVMEKYEIIDAGIVAAAKKYPEIIDTNRIGFFGQSFGAGAVPALAWRAIVERKWGHKGVFLFITAPWYSFGITNKQLASFPSHVKLLMQIYDDDRMNDHHMATDLYGSFTSIPAAEKDFAAVFSDSLEGLVMQANHFVPYGTHNIYGDENLLDYYAVFRPFDALADYAFNKNPEGKKVALGNGSREQTFMGEWAEKKPVRPMEITDSPKPMHPLLRYVFPWENSLNPRRATAKDAKIIPASAK